MEEEDDCKIIEMYEEEAPERLFTPKNRASYKMVAKFLNVTLKIAKTLEDMRKQELMDSFCNTSCKSLDFHDLHTPFCVHRQQFPFFKVFENIFEILIFFLKSQIFSIFGFFLNFSIRKICDFSRQKMHCSDKGYESLFSDV